VTSELGTGSSNPVFNENGRLLSFSQNDNLRTLDLEYVERFVTPNAGIGLLRWFTEYQLLINKADGLYIIDYNGFNLAKLPPQAALSPAQTSFFNSNKSVFFLADNKIRYFLLQSKNQFLNF